MLKIQNLHTFYGNSHILQGVDLFIKKGEIVSLLGRNGVGRSTLCKSIMGLVRATGSIYYNGTEIIGLPSHQIAHQGIGYVPEDRSIFPGLTVLQNLELGMKNVKKTGRWGLDDMFRLFPQLEERKNLQGELLSGGEQQMLAMCRTLMGNPDLMMIDEPTEGLAPRLVQEIGDFLQEIAGHGISTLLVEQKLSITLNISQRLYIMGHGKIVFEGTPQNLEDYPRIRQEWLEV
ncbi:MAG: ABC transporter ATP-binding protein [SAR324 cluster bacterium]|nr:ABC transporter ATP-binding protein [SAR324 cluster bacterium]